jgi:hypothetical protein
MNEEWIDPDSALEAWGSEEDASAYQVLSIDPGGTTGWAIFSVHPDAMGPEEDIRIADNVESWTAGEFTGSQDSQCDAIIDLVIQWPSARLVTEGFKLRQLNAELSPVEINAVLRWAVRPRYWVVQSSALAMGVVTDDRQKAWGFWVPGKQHARDAVKHNITFLKRAKERAILAGRAGFNGKA